MDAATVRFLAAGFGLSCLVGVIWFSAEPTGSDASDATSSTEPAGAGAEDAASGDWMNSKKAVVDSPQGDVPLQQFGGALARLDTAVGRIEARYASIWEAFTRLNSLAVQEVTQFRRLSLTFEDGAITTKTTEAWAPVADHVQWMKKSVASAKRIRREAQMAIRTFGVDATASSNLDPAVNAIIEMAYLTETGSRSGAARTKQHERRACELLAILKPYVPAKRADRVRDAEEECKAKGY